MLRLESIHSLERPTWNRHAQWNGSNGEPSCERGQYSNEQRVRLCQTLHTLELMEQGRNGILGTPWCPWEPNNQLQIKKKNGCHSFPRVRESSKTFLSSQSASKHL
jgi:hypothetical protein